MEFLNRLLGRNPDAVKANVEIYTWQTCPYCIRAKLLLWWKGAAFYEYKIDGDEAARAQWQSAQINVVAYLRFLLMTATLVDVTISTPAMVKGSLIRF